MSKYDEFIEDMLNERQNDKPIATTKQEEQCCDTKMCCDNNAKPTQPETKPTVDTSIRTAIANLWQWAKETICR